MTLESKLSEMAEESIIDLHHFNGGEDSVYPATEKQKLAYKAGYKLGAEMALGLPEVRELVAIVNDLREEYCTNNDHSGSWDSEGNLIDHSTDCLKCKMENAIKKWNAFVKGDEK